MPLPLSKKTIVSILYSSGQINSALNNVLKPYDISIQQFNVLRILRGQGAKPTSLNEVNERMIDKSSNTTRLIDKLIKKQLVNKKPNNENGRKIDISITKKGLALLNEIDVLIDNEEKKIIHSLSENETIELIRLLDKIRLIAN